MCSKKGNHSERAGVEVGLPNLDCSLLPVHRLLLSAS